MAEEVIQARSIELLDAQGQPSLILTGRDEEGRAGLMVSSVEEDAPLVTLGIDMESGNPFFLMGNSEEGASVSITFIEGRVLLALRNADGGELTITP
jgi:hypothetical protein